MQAAMPASPTSTCRDPRLRGRCVSSCRMNKAMLFLVHNQWLKQQRSLQAHMDISDLMESKPALSLKE